MVYSNLAGTTSKKFEIGSRPIGNGQYGQIAASNIYDIYWGGNHPSTGGSSAIATRLGPNQDILNVDVGQYYYIDTSPVRNGPGVQEQFVMLVEPANGNFLGQKRYTLKYVNNGGIWIYDDTASRLGWQKVAFTSNISAGPTVETGTFRLSAPNVTVLAYPYFNYIKYGKIVMADLSCRIAPIVMGKGAITLTGMPFLPEQDVKGVFISCACTVDVKGEVAVTSGQLIYLDNGNMSIYLNLVEGRALLLSCENIKGAIDISGTIVYVAK